MEPISVISAGKADDDSNRPGTSRRRSATGGEGATLSLITIYEISKLLNSSFNIEQTVHDILNLLSSYMQMRRGTVLLKGSDDKFKVVAAAGMSLKGAKSEDNRYPATMAEKVAATAMPLVLSNVADDPEFADYLKTSDILDEERISFVCVPIKGSDNKPFGTLSIERFWDSSAAFNFEGDVRFLTMVANLIGQTVQLHKRIASDRQRLMAEKAQLQKRIEDEIVVPVTHGLDDVVGTSSAMDAVFEQVARVAPSGTTVMLRGESGTGKELIARAIHQTSSRKNKPFIKVNCAALTETLLESELFGHEKGAFTGATSERKGRFEAADGGSLFLDEIGEISGAFQAKLLRVLQEGEFERVGGNKTHKVDVRIIAATNRNLEENVANGDFRADLYYRLNVLPIFLPPLRERGEDIELLARHFLERFSEENGRKLVFSEEAMAVLKRCYFPGNVRELENCVGRVAIMSKGPVIRDVDLACQRNACLSSALWRELQTPGAKPIGGLPRPTSPTVPATPAPAVPSAPPVAESFDDGIPGEGMSQRDRLLGAMEKSGWVQAKAARLLGLTPRQVGYALKKYNIPIKKI